MSTQHNSKSGVERSRALLNSSWKRRFIAEVPEQSSRERMASRALGPVSRNLDMHLAREDTHAAVSCLTDICERISHSQSGRTCLGIRTPGLHWTSSSPKNSEPKRYCNGYPVARFLHSFRRSVRHPSRLRMLGRLWTLLSACSRSHRNSFHADSTFLQLRRRSGRCIFSL